MNSSVDIRKIEKKYKWGNFFFFMAGVELEKI